jgi:hypothetical protein
MLRRMRWIRRSMMMACSLVIIDLSLYMSCCRLEHSVHLYRLIPLFLSGHDKWSPAFTPICIISRAGSAESGSRGIAN